MRAFHKCSLRTQLLQFALTSLVPEHTRMQASILLEVAIPYHDTS
jgi:hypothetical protein